VQAEEILRLVEILHQEKGIDRELIFQSVEVALGKAAGKKLMDIEADPEAVINRETGDVTFYEVEIEEIEEQGYDEETGEPITEIREVRHVKPDEVIPLDPGGLGRVAAQTAKQVIIQRLREAERDSLYDEFEVRKRDIIVGTVQRLEGPNIIVNLENRTEGFFPKWEQVRDEQYKPGGRVKAIILDVKKVGQRVKIILSRTHPDFVRRLFEQEVPEIAEHVIEIKALVREPGYRSKVAVSSIDAKVDAVGACVGVRGSRIKQIIEELNGEKIDIIRWHDMVDILIQNALKPAQIASITLDYDHTKARVVVPDDQQPLAIGKGGQNVRLASRLTGWDIDIMSRTDEARLRTQALKKFCTIPDVDEIMAARIFDAGYTKFDELLEAGAETLSTNVDGINPEFGEKICDFLFEMDEDEYYREIEIDESEILALETATQASARQRFGELFSDLDEEDFEETAEAKPLSGRPQTTKLRPSEIFRAGEGGAPTQPLPPGAEPGAEAPAAHTFTPEWVATWKSRLPEHVDQALAGLRNRIGKRMADGEPFTSEDFESAYSAKGLSPSHYTRFHAQFEDDDAEYRDRFTAEIGALLALTGESQPDAVAAALAEISGYPYLGTAVASGPLSCARPDAFPVADWTSFALILCPAGPLGQGNPLFAVAPEIKQRIQQVTQIDVELGEDVRQYGEMLGNAGNYIAFTAILRDLKNLDASFAEVSVHDISLALWAFGLASVKFSHDRGSWSFAPEADPERLSALGFDPEFALDLETHEAPAPEAE
jgi:N utilization substance protein A